VVLAFVPVLNFCFLFLMVFKRGDDGSNGYGKAPAPNNRALKIVATILPGIIALWAFAAFAVPVYFKYEARQRANAPDAPAWVRYTVPPSELKNH
jgi:heme/copper-type cytochrome/quinol oxidase subunit 2